MSLFAPNIAWNNHSYLIVYTIHKTTKHGLYYHSYLVVYTIHKTTNTRPGLSFLFSSMQYTKPQNMAWTIIRI